MSGGDDERQLFYDTDRPSLADRSASSRPVFHRRQHRTHASCRPYGRDAIILRSLPAQRSQICRDVDRSSDGPPSASAHLESAGAAMAGLTVWIQSQARSAAAQVKRLLAKNKVIDVETAVQITLLNNKGLQAAYADLGDSAANAWQSAMFINPTVAIGMTGIGTPELQAFKTIEAMITTNMLALETRNRDVAIADTRFRQAQLTAAVRTLQVAADTRRAWIGAVAAWETVGQLQRAQAAADAASELAEKLGETGAMTKGAQAREHVFVAELAGETAKARLAARLAKVELTRLMGVWGSDLDYQVPNGLPPLPKSVVTRDTIEAEKEI
ncbi:hypothetical conserved protein (plasmid) [Rhizobium etli CFN 42]|uniref:Hypothetical conserved protein n=1 Tax=Rhizobium etli (strain ATCC 51251 / DSM 11541 / JCM 21823 / NBRC 15573 / CFN 42) TaxID=347834 RepID=Q2K0M9_RHIEC|nr:hypothetical conserved protein [Rhizobium etli CFN 42]